MVNMKEIAKEIREVRESSGLSQEQFARKIGMNTSTYTKYEMAIIKKPTRNLAKILKSDLFKKAKIHINKTDVSYRLNDKSMALIDELENEYSKLGNVPENNKKLQKLRKMVGVNVF